jgi:hypothetical protein
VDIRSILQFNQAHIESLTFQPAEKDPTASLVLSANLTPELAATMRCQEAVFDSQGKPHPHVTRLDLGEALTTRPNSAATSRQSITRQTTPSLFSR